MRLVLPNAQALDVAEAIWVLYRTDKLVEYGFPPDSRSIDSDGNGVQVFPPVTLAYVNAEPVYLSEWEGPPNPMPDIDPDNLQINVDEVVQAMQGRTAIIAGGAEITIDVSGAT